MPSQDPTLDSNDQQLLALIEAARAGDPDARAQLLECKLPALTSYVRQRLGRRLRSRETSQDLVQSVCREVLKDFERHEVFEYDSEKGFERWLFVCAENKIRNRSDYWNRERRDAARENPEAHVDLISLATPSRHLATKESLAKLEKAIAGLPDEYQEVILLARVTELPHEEIARKMNRTVLATRSLLSRALALLAARL